MPQDSSPPPAHPIVLVPVLIGLVVLAIILAAWLSRRIS